MHNRQGSVVHQRTELDLTFGRCRAVVWQKLGPAERGERLLVVEAAALSWAVAHDAGLAL